MEDTACALAIIEQEAMNFLANPITNEEKLG